MNLGLLVLFLPQIRAGIDFQYLGFDSCGYHGWECRDDEGNSVYHEGESVFEVTYNCISYLRVGRIWIWTARLPDSTKKFTIANCDHIELHSDCTTSYRSANIQEFRAVNISHLELLSTSNGYLHDNGYHHHLPPLFHLENIRVLSSLSEKLEISKNEDCRYNSDIMKKIIMKNVTIEKLQVSSATGEYDIFWSGVTVKEVDSKAINVKGNITIEDSHFLNVKGNAMTFEGENVIFSRNTFDTLYEASINVTSFTFNFNDNKLNFITKNGLKIKSSHVNISRNHITHLERNAFGDISPYYYSKQGTYSLSYSFTGNEMEILSPFSLHSNWNDYEKTCTKFIINDNKFHCTCFNLVWLNAFREKKATENTGFYDLLLNTTHHCGTSTNCSLSEIIKFICYNESSIESQCGGFREKETIDVPTEQVVSYSKSGNDTKSEEGTESYREVSYQYETTGGESNLVPLEGNQGSEKYNAVGIKHSQDPGNRDSNRMILDKDYYADHTVSPQGTVHYFPVWVIAVIAIGLIALIASVFVPWYLRRRRNQKCIQIYKYNKNNDSDSLIVGMRIDGDNSSNNILSD